MKKFSKYSTYIFYIGIFLALLVFLNIQSVKIGYQIEENKKENIKLKNKNDYLFQRISSLKSNKNIEKMAFNIGLKYPEPSSIIILEDMNNKKEKRSLFAKLFKINNSGKAKS